MKFVATPACRFRNTRAITHGCGVGGVKRSSSCGYFSDETDEFKVHICGLAFETILRVGRKGDIVLQFCGGLP